MKIIFTQPFLVNAELALQTEGSVAVLDIAFNGGSPMGKGTNEEQFNTTTKAFIDALGDRLALWVDHHPHKEWATYKDDPRFILVPREEAPACPPLITLELCEHVGEIYTIIAHGDFDGVMSAAKYIFRGDLPYPECDTDSIAADSRIGTMSERGIRYEEAMKADLRDDMVRQAIIDELDTPHYAEYGQNIFGGKSAKEVIDDARAKYASIQQETQRLAALYRVIGRIAYVDAFHSKAFDYTALLLAGQKIADVAVVRDSINNGNDAIIGIAGPRNWNFVEMFGLGGGMPNRITLPDQDIEKIIEKINNF